jgi:hypothetical protein
LAHSPEIAGSRLLERGAHLPDGSTGSGEDDPHRVESVVRADVVLGLEGGEMLGVRSHFRHQNEPEHIRHLRRVPNEQGREAHLNARSRSSSWRRHRNCWPSHRKFIRPTFWPTSCRADRKEAAPVERSAKGDQTPGPPVSAGENTPFATRLRRNKQSLIIFCVSSNHG